MKKQTTVFVAMWGAAITVMLFIWLAGGSVQDEVRPTDQSGIPIRVAGEDNAPNETRVNLPVRPPSKGPPQTFRGDRRHTARSAAEGPRSADLAWRFESGARITAQAVLGPDGSVYVGSHDGHLYALSEHGVERWKRNLGDRIYSTPAVDEDGNVYVGSDADTFFSFSPSGDPRWRLETEGDADTGVTIADDGTVHFAAGKSLYAVARDGTAKWRFDAQGKIYTTPAVDDDGTVYVGSQDDHLYAVAADGLMRWSYQTRGDIDSSPVIGDDGTIFFGSDDHHVYGVDRDGELRWSTDLDGYVRAPVALAFDGSIIAGTYGPRPRIASLDAETGQVRWFFPVTVADSAEIGIAAGATVDREGNIYIGAHDDYIYSLAPSGEMRWIFEANGDVDSSPILGPDGTLYVGSDDRYLYAIRTP
ncbi:MAG: PQQ-binding-like beta-propeller repeat protein [Myxococcota bacterium]